MFFPEMCNAFMSFLNGKHMVNVAGLERMLTLVSGKRGLPNPLLLVFIHPARHLQEECL